MVLFSIFVKTSNGTQLITATKIIEKCESLSKISLCKQILVFKHSKSIKLCFVFKKNAYYTSKLYFHDGDT